MTAVLVELKPPTSAAADLGEIEIVPDLEALSDEGRCNCAASDDNPY